MKPTMSVPPVMILCGGEGSRLREETELRPKPMLEIGARPILWHLMKFYATHGATDFLLCLGYKGQVIKEFFLHYKAHSSDLTLHLGDPNRTVYHSRHAEENWRVTLVETGARAQTGTRVARAARYLEADTFCLTYGDGLGSIDIAKLLAFHKSHGKLGTVTGVHPPGRFGEMNLDKTGRAIEFNEKLQTTEGIINGGFFVFERAFVERYLDAGTDDCTLEREPLQRLARDGELMVYKHDGFWQPMDTFREWRLLNELWDSGKAPWKIW